MSNNVKVNIINQISESNKISLKTKINNASINSKEIKKNDIFCAIKGKKRDGNLFVKEAFKRGASLAIVNIQKKRQNKLK